MSEINKRKIVEDWLHDVCISCETLASMEDDYHPGEYDTEIDELLAATEGLVQLYGYEPGSDEWENFDPEGYLWSSPTDEQVERLFSHADAYLKELKD